MVKLVTPVCDFGLPAKAFELKSVDGKQYSLQDCLGKHGLVVAFICNHCPYVQAILPRLVEDARVLIESGIGVVAIASNDIESYPEDSFENMQILAEQHGFSFPYLLDETQDIAKSYGAVCTPDFFGYSSDLKLQYRGRLDASGIYPSEPGVKRELVESMLLVARTGKGPESQIASQGCSIKWKNG